VAQGACAHKAACQVRPWELLRASRVSGRQKAGRPDVRRAAAEIWKGARPRVALRRLDEFVPQPPGACPAGERAGLVPAETAAREVFVPLAACPGADPLEQARLSGVARLVALPQVTLVRPLPVAPQPERQVAQELCPEQPGERARLVLEEPLPEPPRVSPLPEPCLPARAAHLLAAVKSMLEALETERQERLPVSAVARLAEAPQASQLELRQSVSAVRLPAPPDARASPWPPSSPLPQRLPCRPVRGNAFAQVRRAQCRASSNASFSPRRRFRARSRSGLLP